MADLGLPFLYKKEFKKLKKLPYGVMVAHLILVQLVWVRILVGQHRKIRKYCGFFLLLVYIYSLLISQKIRNRNTADYKILLALGVHCDGFVVHLFSNSYPKT